MGSLKEEISTAVKNKMKYERMSLRKLAENIDNISYTQIHRVTRKDNYNIDTLEKVLDALGLEFQLVERNK